MSSTTTTTTTLKPNSGAAVPDVAAAGDDHQTQAEWLSANGVADPSARIAMTRLSHVRYQHPDLEEISTFLAGTSATKHSPFSFSPPAQNALPPCIPPWGLCD